MKPNLKIKEKKFNNQDLSLSIFLCSHPVDPNTENLTEL